MEDSSSSNSEVEDTTPPLCIKEEVKEEQKDMTLLQSGRRITRSSAKVIGD